MTEVWVLRVHTAPNVLAPDHLGGWATVGVFTDSSKAMSKIDEWVLKKRITNDSEGKCFELNPFKLL